MTSLAADTRARCRWMRWISLGAAAALAFALAVPVLAIPFTDARDALYTALLVRMLPGLCYLYALVAIERSFAAMSHGSLLLPVLAAALTRVGLALAIGSAISILLVYNLLRVIEVTQGGYLHVDIPGIALGVVGLALVPLADLLRRAHAAEVELDEII